MADSSTADELAIRALVHRYSDAVVRRDEAAWAETWAEDGEWHIMGRPTKGRDEVVALWRTLMSGFPFVVQIPGSGVIELAGDQATGRWSMTEHGRGPGGTGMLTLGLYRDSYSRIRGEWRFARRRFDPMYMGPADLSAEPLQIPADEEGSA